MHIFVINCGSSSIKTELINAQDATRVLSIKIERIESAQPILTIEHNGQKENKGCEINNYEGLLSLAFSLLTEKIDINQVAGIGHRVAHGGATFDEAAIIDENVIEKIQELCSLAPLHNPVALSGIRCAKMFFPNIPHIAVFDTAFHATLPKRAQIYAIPSHLSDKYHIRRYGFHGTSHEYVAHKAAEALKTNIRDLRIITCHLGSGASICAIEYGRSIETSMGMTPLEGLVMGTRSGDIDPGILLFLMEKENMTLAQLNKLLNKESGLVGISGSGNDMRDIEEKAAQGDEAARMAIHVFTHRLRKYIGAYTALMGGVDAIVFTAGIGENSALIRHRATQRLEFLGAILDEDKNRNLTTQKLVKPEDISTENSRCKILVIPTDEQYAIAQQAYKLIKEKYKVNTIPDIPIAVSARHIHLCQESVEKLFGKGYQLTVYKPLSQPGQYACQETLTLIGIKNKIEHVRILGPTRAKDQVEISRTDEFFLGIDAPIRESGHTENSPGITLMTPNGNTLELKEGVICAWRHIHMSPEDAKVFQVVDKDVVDVAIKNEQRSMTFGNVLIRVSPQFKLEMHIDTDEANAAEISQGASGSLLSTNLNAHLTKRKMMNDLVEE